MTVHPSHIDHPIDVLAAEHEVILAALRAIDQEERALAEGGPFIEEYWHRVTDFLAEFADRCHHGKEEDLLFGELAMCGLPEGEGPLAVMRMEHDQGRFLRARMESALAVGDVTEMCAATRELLELLRVHIDKEDNVLFPMARQRLSPDQVIDLGRKFESFARDTIGEEKHHRYVALAHELCSDAAVEFA